MIARMGWIITAAILVFFQFKLISPLFTFSGLFRAYVWLAILANAGFAIALGIQLFDWKTNRFTTRSMMGWIVFISFSLAMVHSLQNHSPMKTGFNYSKKSLQQCVVDGDVGDQCGLYSVTAIVKGNGFTALFVKGDPENASHSCGFIRLNSEVDLQSQLFDQLGHFFLPLGDGWFAFYSVYNWNNMGWS